LTRLLHKNFELLLKGTAYGKKFFPSTESDTELLQSIYFV